MNKVSEHGSLAKRFIVVLAAKVAMAVVVPVRASELLAALAAHLVS